MNLPMGYVRSGNKDHEMCIRDRDYWDGKCVDCVSGAVSAMELSGSNVLRYELADGTSVIVRPSGTEPKIKVYILAQGKDAADANANLEKYGRWVEALKP